MLFNYLRIVPLLTARNTVPITIDQTIGICWATVDKACPEPFSKPRQKAFNTKPTTGIR